MDFQARFVAAFRKGIEAEKASLRADASAYEVALEQPTPLEPRFTSFRVPRPSERLVAGAQCGLRDATGLELPVTLVQLEGERVTVQSELALNLQAAPYSLIFVPWFLYDEMASALEHVPFPETALKAFGKLPCARLCDDPVEVGGLNESQGKAVEHAIRNELTILWGPPGTGKTTTLAAIVANLLDRERRVLIASNTHAALDQVMLKLDQRAPGEIVKLSALDEVVAITQKEARLTLERSLRRLQEIGFRQRALVPMLEQAGRTQQLDLFAEPCGPCDDGSARLEVLQRMHRRLEVLHAGHTRRAREARARLSHGQQQAVSQAKVILSTLANLSVSPLMKGEHFDVVIVEEAGMALLPAVYLAAGRARKQVILVGDPQQLPAILSTRDPFAQQALGRNIFDVLGERPERVMLDVQYRMHPHIGELVNRLFYGGHLRHQPHPDVEAIAAQAPFAEQAVVVVDSGGKGSCSTDPGDYSRYNQATAARAVELAHQAAASGASVAVIAPYRKQVRRIQTLLSERGLDDVDCATVHRFQGHERDVVILDTVDGPPLEPGTLLRANLLNVSLSRARGKLILIADVEYVKKRAANTALHQVLEAALKTGSLSRL